RSSQSRRTARSLRRPKKKRTARPPSAETAIIHHMAPAPARSYHAGVAGPSRLDQPGVVHRLTDDRLHALRRLVVGVDPGQHLRPVLQLDDDVPPRASRRLDDLAVADAVPTDGALDR